MEYRKKCNVCGKIFCYTDKDVKDNLSNAGLAALESLGSLASAPRCEHGNGWHPGKPLHRRFPEAVAAILLRWEGSCQ